MNFNYRLNRVEKSRKASSNIVHKIAYERLNQV